MGDDIIRTYIDKIGKYEQISKSEKEIFIKSYKCIFIGSLLDWLEEDASYDLAEFYEEMYKIFAGAGERAISGQLDK